MTRTLWVFDGVYMPKCFVVFDYPNLQGREFIRVYLNSLI